MTPEFAVDLLKNLMYHAVLVAAPVLVAAMLIGLAISLFQAVTTIHEQTLSFVPKALGIVALLVLLMPWAIRILTEFATLVIQKIPEMAR